MKYNNKTRTRKERKKTFKRRKRKTRKNNHKRGGNGGSEQDALHRANQRIIDIENRGWPAHLAIQAMSPEGITVRDLFYPIWPPSKMLTKLPPPAAVRKMTDEEAYYERLGNRHAIKVKDELYVNKPSHGPKFKGRSRKKEVKKEVKKEEEPEEEEEEEEGEEDDDDSVGWWWRG